MDTKQLHQLVQQAGSVVIVDGGRPVAVVQSWEAWQRANPGTVDAPGSQPVSEEVPIASRWPKGRSINESRQDHVLERLNKEILALKAQIAQEEESSGQ